MEVTDARLAAQVEGVLCSFDVGAIRLANFAGGDEAQAGGVVQHAVAVLIDPMPSVGIEAEERFADIPFKHVRPRQFLFEKVFPSTHQTLDAVRSRLTAATAGEDGHWHVSQQQVLQQVASQQAGRSGQQNVIAHHVSCG